MTSVDDEGSPVALESISIGARLSWPMYPFPEWRQATTRWWDRALALIGWRDSPPALEPWTSNHRDAWSDPDLFASQCCGWPVVTWLADAVVVAGACRFAVEGAHGINYRSVVVVPAGSAVETAAELAGADAVINDFDSLSGWISLIAAVHPPGDGWSGAVRATGSHLASLAEVAAGRAEVATIDPVSLAYARRHRAELADGVRQVGWGPLVPSVPIIVGRGHADRARALVEALDAAIDDEVRETLLIDGVERATQDTYAELTSLTPAPSSFPGG